MAQNDGRDVDAEEIALAAYCGFGFHDVSNPKSGIHIRPSEGGRQTWYFSDAT